MESEHSESPGPVFVLGCPRSGTTFVGSLLLNTSWGRAVETHFITKYDHKAARVDLNRRNDFERLVKAIIAERYIRQWGITWDLEELYNSVLGGTYAELAHQICLCRSRKLGHTSWADKTPHYCDSAFKLRRLRQLFPHAKFVFLVRDGRDVANSLLKKPWGPNNVWACASYWRACCEAIETCSEEFGSSAYCMQYEELVSQPAKVIEELFVFLDAELPIEAVHKLADRVDAARTEQWKKGFSSRQIAVFENLAGDQLASWGYSTANDAKSLCAPACWTYQAHDKAMWAAHMFRMNVVDGLRIRFRGMKPFAD